MQYYVEKSFEINAATSLKLRTAKCAMRNLGLVAWTCD